MRPQQSGLYGSQGRRDAALLTRWEGAMPALPKHPSARQRRNKTVSARTLTAVPSGKAPALPEGREWRPETLTWWADVWRSPMAPEYDESDRHGLFLLAVLVDAFWTEPSERLAGEIRLQRQCFGLSPIDRRRLQWEIDRGEQAEAKRERRRTPAPKASPAAADPRAMLAG